MPQSVAVMPQSVAVMPQSAAVMPQSVAVIPDLIRDPVLHHPWIAGAETPDPGSSPGQALIRGRNDKFGTQ
jgi:hypothetical protein